MIPPISLSQGVRSPSFHLPCATFRHIYTPFPRYSWYGFVSLGGFPRPIPKISKYFLARGDFLLKIWRANYGASRASLGGCTRGVALFRVASVPVHLCRPWGCPAACQTVRNSHPFLCPLSCPVINSALKMDYYTIQGGKMALRASNRALRGYCLIACVRTLSRKGERAKKSLSRALSLALGLLCICRPVSARPVSCSLCIGRQRQKRAALVWVALSRCGVVFLLSTETLLRACLLCSLWLWFGLGYPSVCLLRSGLRYSKGLPCRSLRSLSDSDKWLSVSLSLPPWIRIRLDNYCRRFQCGFPFHFSNHRRKRTYYKKSPCNPVRPPQS